MPSACLLFAIGIPFPHPPLHTMSAPPGSKALRIGVAPPPPPPPPASPSRRRRPAALAASADGPLGAVVTSAAAPAAAPPPHGAGPAPSPPCLEPLVERPPPAASDESVVVLPWPTALGGRPAAVAAALITGLAGHTLHARGGCPVPVQVLLEKENDDDVRHAVTACEAPLTTASAATSAAATVAAAAGAAVRGANGRAPRGASPDDARAVAALAARLRALTSAVAAFCAAPPGVTAAAVVFTRPAGRAAGSLRVGGAPRVADDLYMLRFVGEGWVNDGGGGRPCAAVGEEMGAGGGPGGGPGGGERHAAAVDAAVRTLLRAVVARTSGSAYLGRALRTLGGEGVGGNVGDGGGVDARGLDSC